MTMHMRVALLGAAAARGRQIVRGTGEPDPATAPAQMAAPTVTATGPTSVTVAHAALPDDGGSEITRVDGRYSVNGGDTWTTVEDIDAAWVISDLEPETEVLAQTAALNAVGLGEWSPSGTDTTPAAYGFSVEVDALVMTTPEGEVSVTISAPAAYAGTYAFHTDDFATGPVLLVLPDIAGTVVEGQALTALPALWLHDPDDDPFSAAVLDWQRRTAGSSNTWVSTSTGGLSFVVGIGDAAFEYRVVPSATSAAGTTVGAPSNTLAPDLSEPDQEITADASGLLGVAALSATQSTVTADTSGLYPSS